MLNERTRGGVVVAEMMHGKVNALDLEFCRHLIERFRAWSEGSARAVVLTGTGEVFSAGVDLLWVIEEPPEYVDEFLPALEDAFQAAFVFPKPLVAAVNGHAIAGGCVLACAADLRLLAKGSFRVGLPELKVGVPFPSPAVEILRHTLPATVFTPMLLAGAEYWTNEAHEAGIVDAVHKAGGLVEEAWAAAEQMARVPEASFRLTKLQIRKPGLDLMLEGRRQSDAAVLACWKAPETRDEIRAFVSRSFKRKGRRY